MQDVKYLRGSQWYANVRYMCYDVDVGIAT
jgi:hypothetical protein